MPEYRRREMAAAARALGIEQVWLGFVDSGLPEGDPLPPLPEGCFALEPLEVPVGALVRQVREFRPHVMTCYDENGGYPHPDHVMAHKVAVAAYEAAADPAAYPEAGEPWAVQKAYYDISFSLARIEAIHAAMEERGLTSPFAEWFETRHDRPSRQATVRVECAAYFPQRDAALRAHATQIDPDGFFFQVPRDLEAEVWPFEEFEPPGHASRWPTGSRTTSSPGCTRRISLPGAGAAADGARPAAEGGRDAQRPAPAEPGTVEP